MSAFLLALRDDDPDYRLTHRWLALAVKSALWCLGVCVPLSVAGALLTAWRAWPW